MTLHILELITQLVSASGYIGIFITMTLESMLVPIPSEAVMPFAGFLVYEGKMDIWIAVLVSSVANLLGSIIAYVIGKYLGRGFVERYGKYVMLDMHHVEMVENWFRKYGSITILFSRMLPVFRTVNALPAGIGKMDFSKFCMYTFIGSVPWNLALVYAGYLLKENWNILEKYTIYIDIVAVITILLLLIYIARKMKWGSRLNDR
jgi:membrane protein DedA with SNARE-associated domain